VVNSLFSKNNNDISKKISESVKLLEFFNFSNFSEYYEIEKDDLFYSDFEKKNKKKNILPYNKKSLNNPTYTKKLYFNDNQKLNFKKKYKNFDSNNYDLYVKFEYLFKYFNSSLFLTTKVNFLTDYN
jgi:hypothetical protein